MTIAITPEFLQKLVQLHVGVSEDLMNRPAADSHEAAVSYASAVALRNSIANLLQGPFDFRPAKDERKPQFEQDAILLVETNGSVRLDRFTLVEYNDYSRAICDVGIGWTQETENIRKTLIAYAY